MMLRLLLCALLTLASSCTTTSRPKWVEGEVRATSHEVLWDVTRMSIRKAGFPVVEDPDPRSMTLESGWRQDLAPFRGKGYRERIIVRYKPTADGRYTIEVRCKREVNKDIIRPLDATYAAWEAAEDNEARARILMQNIRARIDGALVIPEDEPETANR